MVDHNPTRNSLSHNVQRQVQISAAEKLDVYERLMGFVAHGELVQPRLAQQELATGRNGSSLVVIENIAESAPSAAHTELRSVP